MPQGGCGPTAPQQPVAGNSWIWSKAKASTAPQPLQRSPNSSRQQSQGCGAPNTAGSEQGMVITSSVVVALWCGARSGVTTTGKGEGTMAWGPMRSAPEAWADLAEAPATWSAVRGALNDTPGCSP